MMNFDDDPMAAWASPDPLPEREPARASSSPPPASPSPSQPPTHSTEPDPFSAASDDEDPSTLSLSAPALAPQPSSSSPSPSPTPPHTPAADDFADDPTFSASPAPVPADDFGDDDFDDSFAGAGEGDDNDAFGEFGDFGGGGDGGFEEAGAGDEDEDGFMSAPGSPIADSSRAATPLPGPAPAPAPTVRTIDPLSPSLSSDLSSILETLFPPSSYAASLSPDPERQVEGLPQVLVSSSSRETYQTLLSPPSSLPAPPNFTRSLVRRQHLIALGIPINLDEILPTSPSSRPALPPLQISVTPQQPPSRPASQTGWRDPAGLPSKPALDWGRAEELMGLDGDQLPLLPPARLQTLLSELQRFTSSASSLLAYELQLRDGLAHDAETYNAMIQELVRNASAKMSAAAHAPGAKNKARASGSGWNSPVAIGRTGSPVVGSRGR